MEQEQQKPITFEEALTRLETIAEILDSNDVPLAEALQLCAEATRLLRVCRAQLVEAEGKLEQLIETADGEIRVEPLVID